MHLKVTVDGVALTRVKSYWGAIYYSAPDGGWKVGWHYDAGHIARHRAMSVRMKFTLDRQLTDGWHTYAAGSSLYKCAIAAGRSWRWPQHRRDMMAGMRAN